MAQPGFRNMQVKKNFMSHVPGALEIFFLGWSLRKIHDYYVFFFFFFFGKKKKEIIDYFYVMD